jgi:2-polyprenyl-3-methyl-5-hydroxy-6-metoxy-1,4-benzoquinol methylase
MPIRRDLHQDDARSWDAATAAHESHKPGQAAFPKDGGATLFAEERALLGDVRGQRVLHTLCKGGAPTPSIAALGASVTGVDISEVAIATARKLAEASGVAGTFAGIYHPRWQHVRPYFGGGAPDTGLGVGG